MPAPVFHPITRSSPLYSKAPISGVKTLSIPISWVIRTGITNEISWRVQPACSVGISWGVKTRLDSTISWKVRRAPFGTIAWRVVSDIAAIPGLNTHEVSCEYGGSKIDITDLSIGTDVSSVAWSISFNLTNETDYALLTQGKTIQISVDDVTWTVVVKSRKDVDVFNNKKWALTAVSAFAMMREDNISIETTKTTPILDIVNEVVFGLPISWRVITWSLPRGISVAQNVSRVSVLSNIAQTVGAEVFSDPDGTIIVAYSYASSGSPIYAWDDSDTFEHTKSIIPTKYFGSVLVGSSGLYLPRTIRINELSSREKDEKILVVFVSPESIPPTISDSGNAHIAIYPQGSYTEEYEELVVFTDGVGSVGVPVNNIISVDYGSNNNIGSVSVVDEGILVGGDAEDTIATIKYNSKGYTYLIKKEGTDEEHTLFCASASPIRYDILVNVSRTPVPSNISPEIFQSKLCTNTEVAFSRGKSYLARHDGDRVKLDIDKLWVGANFLNINSMISLDGKLYQITSVNLSYSFPEISYSVSLEEIGGI